LIIMTTRKIHFAALANNECVLLQLTVEFCEFFLEEI